MVMGQEDGISLLSDTVDYNLSYLSGWVQSMLSKLNDGSNDIVRQTQFDEGNKWRKGRSGALFYKVARERREAI
ncbi:hypothetical protein Vadar_000295 [Vaccinium darrowii]|uniref:Uncharacterized protein n=1 Tax=Vaccinium darrowii TaxID=229202 RepID=A0ACB7YB01_9ERIC|nr:hypothetical protein Vadar_000295 [Vaccinium darrowii]